MFIYLKFIIMVFIISMSVEAAPKTYNSLSRELEPLHKKCKNYQNSTQISEAIKNDCKIYNAKVNKAFKLGYKLDSYIDTDKMNEKKLNKYLKLLNNADEVREKLIFSIKTQFAKARRDNNVKSYSELIFCSQITLKDKDYTFMKQHSSEMKDNLIYIKYMAMVEQKIRDKEERKKAEELKKKKEQKERHKKILMKAQQDLKRQIRESKREKEVQVSFRQKKDNNHIRYTKRTTESHNTDNYDRLKQQIEAYDCKEIWGNIVQKLNTSTYEVVLHNYNERIIFKTINTEYTSKGFATFFVKKQYYTRTIKTKDGFSENWKVYNECLGYDRWKKLKSRLYNAKK